MGRPCIIADCDELVSDRSRLDACKTCRAAINRWKKRRPAQILTRRQTLNKYNARLTPLVDDTVVVVKSQRQRERLEEDDTQYIYITRSLMQPKRAGKPSMIH